MEHFQTLHVCKTLIEDNAQGIEMNFRSLVMPFTFFWGCGGAE